MTVQYATSDPHWFGRLAPGWLNAPDPSDILKERLESCDPEDNGVK